MATVLDIFSSDPFFQTAQLSEALIKRPAVPMALGAMNLYQEMPLTVDRVAVEELNQEVGLVPTGHKNAPGTAVTEDKRTGRILEVDTYTANAEVWASDVAGVREFGSPDALRTVQNAVFRKTDKLAQGYFEPTFEYLRMMGIRGYIGKIDSTGTPTTATDLCTVMGVTRATDLNMAAGAGSSTAATQIGYADTIRQRIVEKLGGVPFSGILAVCGRTFFRNLKANSVLLDHIKYAEMGKGMSNSALLQNLGPSNTADMLAAIPVINWQNITWVEYSLALGMGLNSGSVEFIPAAEAVAIPTGVPGHLVRFNAPASYVETINLPGLPLTAKSELKRMGKGVDIEIQARPLFFNSRPAASVRLY